MKFNEPNNLHESLGADLSTSLPTTCTGSGTANAKGSWVNIGGSTSFDYNALTIAAPTGSASDFMLDVGISDGSNRWNLISDLYLPFIKQANEMELIVNLPLYVPAGSQLSIRCGSSVGGSTTGVTMVGHASGLGGAPGFSKCVTLFTPASSRGIAVDPGGTANTKGSWAQITASTPEDIKAMLGIVGFNNDITRAAAASVLFDIGLGSGGSEFVLYPNAFVGWATQRDGPANGVKVPVFACDVPAGSRLAARAQCSITTAGDRTFDLALYGFC